MCSLNVSLFWMVQTYTENPEIIRRFDFMSIEFHRHAYQGDFLDQWLGSGIFEDWLAVISLCSIVTMSLSPESLGGLLYIIIIGVYLMIIITDT